MSRTVGDGRYTLLEPIAAGGMATVWRARDTKLGVDRAIKVLNRDLTFGTGAMSSRFLREARIMARLEHPNVVPVHDVGEDGGELWLVMSLLPGGTVADHVSRHGSMPARQAAGVVQQLLQALAAAHALGVVHRDIKPHNVLIDERGDARLSDFGIAHARADTDEGTATDEVLGTWRYMAPEQRGGARYADARSDVYAVGAVFVVLSALREPLDLMHPGARGDVLDAAPPALRTWLDRCTRLQPDDRFDSAASALSALERAMTRLPPDPRDTPKLGAAAQLAPPATGYTWSPGPGVRQVVGASAARSAALSALWLAGAAALGASTFAVIVLGAVGGLLTAQIAGARGATPFVVPPIVVEDLHRGGLDADRDRESPPAPHRTAPARVPLPPVPARPRVREIVWSADGDDDGGSVPVRIAVLGGVYRVEVDGADRGWSPWQGELGPGRHALALVNADGTVAHRRAWDADAAPRLCLEPPAWEPCRH